MGMRPIGTAQAGISQMSVNLVV